MESSMYYKNTVKHSIIYASATFLQKGTGFVLLPLYAHYLKGEGYGIVGMIDVVLSAMTVLVGFGITGSMQRIYFEKNEIKDKNILVSTAIIVMIFSVSIVTIPIIIFHNQISVLVFGKTGLEHFLLLASFTFVADMTSSCASGYLIINKKSILFSLISSSKLLIGLFLNIYLIAYLKMGVLGFIYSGLFSGLVFTTIMHIYVFKKVGFNFNFNDAKEIMKLNLPMIPGYIAMFVRGNADRVILRTFMGLSELGAYNMLLKFCSLISLFLLQPFLRIWSVNRLEICEKENGPKLMAQMFTFHLALMFFFGLILSLEVPLILKMMTPSEFWVPGGYVFLGILANVLLSSYYHLNFGLIYGKKTGKISIVQISSSIFSLLVSFIFVRHFGLLGGLISPCLTYSFMCSISYYFSSKHYFISFEWGKIIRMIITLTFSFIIIDNISISNLHIDDWLYNNFIPLVTVFFHFFKLDELKDGKILLLLEDNIPLFVEGGIRFILSFSFIFALLGLGIITRQHVLKALSHFSTILRKPIGGRMTSSGSTIKEIGTTL